MKHKFTRHHFESLPSTNDYAKAHIQKLHEADVIICDQQTQGRGRFDRVWHSGFDLTFTMVFHSERPRSLLVPLALVEAFSAMRIKAFIKWPNDILVDDKKVCGILIEKVFQGNDCIGEVCGIGVNISPIPLDLQDKATYVQIEKDVLFEEILKQYTYLDTLTHETLLRMYKNVNYLQGRKILLDDVLWNVEDISEEGYLIVTNQNTSRKLKSEEVTLSHIY